jgi:hypothetical protein
MTPVTDSIVKERERRGSGLLSAFGGEGRGEVAFSNHPTPASGDGITRHEDRVPGTNRPCRHPRTLLCFVKKYLHNYILFISRARLKHF